MTRGRRNVDVVTIRWAATEPDAYGTYPWSVRGRCGCNAHNGTIEGQSLAWGYAATAAEARHLADSWQPNTWDPT